MKEKNKQVGVVQNDTTADPRRMAAKEVDNNGEQVLITSTECTMRKKARPKPGKDIKHFGREALH
jgi:hypothetical protein